MNKPTEYKWEDSNVADFGSLLDREVKSECLLQILIFLSTIL